MGNRLSKIYTRTGDDGTTGMASGERVSKADLLFAVMGDVDELNAHIGLIAAHTRQLQAKQLQTKQPENKHQQPQDPHQSSQRLQHLSVQDSNLPNLADILQSISVIQHLLFNIGGELAMPEYQGIDDTHIIWLESQIDRLNRHLLPLKDFILPAGSALVSQIHVARTVCRRSERQAVDLRTQQAYAMSSNAAKLLNRLSDWLFVLARYCAKLEGSQEVLWDKAILNQFDGDFKI
ncbi:cob(I)yrinic acid a,c-diamide adenosyltransferase [Psychrobacter lutiphocae]|uniref:cob(I)yrinic acid a,c-diamide adenosyltransferase n=1 Tax=Psychrobacter lutiphocae TaxID=540500 RepID=UPI000363360B|nr:cob(I)yrinic acid a,c-diamide adenosyltransferase [Psychrobacter lutiphocae]